MRKLQRPPAPMNIEIEKCVLSKECTLKCKRNGLYCEYGLSDGQQSVGVILTNA